MAIKIDDYYGMSMQVSKRLPDNIKSFYANSIAGMAAEDEMRAVMREWRDNALGVSEYASAIDSGLPTLVWYILTSADVDPDVESLRKNYRLLIKKKRNYYGRVVTEEYEAKKKKGMLTKSCDQYFNMVNLKLIPGKEFSTREEYIEGRYAQVKEWAGTAGSDMIDFPLIFMLTPKKQFGCFLYDLSFHVCDIVVKQFNSDAKNGMLTSVPDYAVGTSMFGLPSQKVPLKTDVMGNEIYSYDEHEVQAKNGVVKIRTIVDVIQGDYSDYQTDAEKEALIEKKFETGELTFKNNLLDSTDWSIFTNIFQRFNMNDVNRGSVKVRLDELTREIFTEAKKERCLSVAEHLDRLTSYNMDLEERDASGKVVLRGRISFFDVIYKIGHREDGKIYHTTATVRDSSEKSSILEELSKVDPKDVTVEILPSKTIKDAISNQMNTVVIREIYEKIVPPKARNMLFFLQKERTSIYPDTGVTFPLSYLVQVFRLEGMRKAGQIKLLDELLGTLKSSGAVVKDYNIHRVTAADISLQITFLPFSDEERILYHIDRGDRLLEKSG